MSTYSSIDTPTYVVSSESFMQPGVPVVTPWRYSSYMQNANNSPTYPVKTSSQIDQPYQTTTHPAHGTTSPGPDTKIHLK